MQHQIDSADKLMNVIVDTALQFKENELDLDKLTNLLSFINEEYEGKFDIQLSRLISERDMRDINLMNQD